MNEGIGYDLDVVVPPTFLCKRIEDLRQLRVSSLIES